jgi:hypothetical protein
MAITAKDMTIESSGIELSGTTDPLICSDQSTGARS